MTPSGRSEDADRLEHLVEHIQDAVVEFRLVGGEPIVEAVNPAFTAIFGYEPDVIVGQSLNEYIVPPWLETEAMELDDRTDSGEVNYRRVRRQTADGLGEFLYRGIPYENEAGAGGFAVYTDLTDGLRKERQLAVLNRVLRHNLRNKITVIDGGIERIDDEFDLDQNTLGPIRDAVAELRQLAEGATDIQQTLEGSVPEDVHVDCADLIESVVADTRDRFPAARIETDLPGELHVATSERLGFAIEALLDNAIRHNDGSAPVVRVRAETVLGGEWVDITVDDDGPVIPEGERDVVTGEREITPMSHGSGLGLWLVKWTVERYGGELTFERCDLGGNRVRLRLRRTPSSPRTE